MGRSQRDLDTAVAGGDISALCRLVRYPRAFDKAADSSLLVGLRGNGDFGWSNADGGSSGLSLLYAKAIRNLDGIARDRLLLGAGGLVFLSFVGRRLKGP